MLEGFYWDMVNQVSNFGKGIMSFVPIKGRFQIFLVKKGKHFVCDMRDETRCGGIVGKLLISPMQFSKIALKKGGNVIIHKFRRINQQMGN